MLEDYGVIQPDPLTMVSVRFDQGAAVAHTRDGIHAIFWREDYEVVWAQNGNALMWSPAIRPPSQPSIDMLTLLEGCLDE